MHQKLRAPSKCSATNRARQWHPPQPLGDRVPVAPVVVTLEQESFGGVAVPIKSIRYFAELVCDRTEQWSELGSARRGSECSGR